MSICAGIERAWTAAATASDELRSDFVLWDAKSLGGSASALHSARMRGTSYVWMAAIIERFTTAWLRALIEELNKASIATSALRPQLWSMLASPMLDSLQDLRGLNMWSRRAEMFAGVLGPATAAFDDNFLPLDGRTIRPTHIDSVFAVLGITHNASLAPILRTALTEIADLRNAVAHGNSSPTLVGRLKTANDVLRRIGHVDQICEHLALVGQEYLDRKAYLSASIPV